VLCLVALAAAGGARAEDDPSCAQYQEPMAYNACLARHGPKAGDVGTHSGESRPERAGQADFRRSPHAQRRHGRVHIEFRVR
jgi:hypothetical protein